MTRWGAHLFFDLQRREKERTFHRVKRGEKTVKTGVFKGLSALVARLAQR